MKKYTGFKILLIILSVVYMFQYTVVKAAGINKCKASTISEFKQYEQVCSYKSGKKKLFILHGADGSYKIVDKDPNLDQAVSDAVPFIQVGTKTDNETGGSTGAQYYWCPEKVYRGIDSKGTMDWLTIGIISGGAMLVGGVLCFTGVGCAGGAPLIAAGVGALWGGGSAATGLVINTVAQNGNISYSLVKPDTDDVDKYELTCMKRSAINGFEISQEDINACEDLFSDGFIKKLNSYFLYVKIAVPIIVLVFGIIEFAKAMFASDDNEMKKAQKRFFMRVVIAFVIFLTPTIITLLLEIANSVWGTIGLGTCGIG